MKKFLKRTMRSVLCVTLSLVALFSGVACKGGKKNKGDDEEVAMKYLIQNGQSDYCVVISQKATETEAFAAEELVSFVEEVTDKKLPLKTDAEVSYGNTTKAICIGENKLSKRAEIEVDPEEVNTDGFVTKNVGEMIFISGAYGRGTLYGVYDFIEKYLGVKFLTADTTYVPKKKDVLVEETLDVTEVPAFQVRNYYATSVTNPLTSARMRFTASGGEGKWSGGGWAEIWNMNQFHNTMEFIQTSPVWEENADEWLNDAKNMICYTNGLTDDGEIDQTMEVSAVKAVIEELKRQILESKPTQKYFMIGQEDHNAPCDCTRCQASVARNGNRTGMMIVWMNAIAREIEKWAATTVPNKEYYISCFSYQWSLSAPVKMDPTTQKYAPVNENVIPHEDVYVMYAPIDSCYYHTLKDESCSMNEPARGQLAGWSAITDRLMIWEYSCNYRHYLWWFPNLSVLSENYKTYCEYGVDVIRTQGEVFDDSGYQQQLKTYLVSKLMWDFDQDVYALVREFNQYYFEEAADSMNAFVDLFESHFAMLNMHSELFENTQKFLAAETYPLELLEKAVAYTEEGMALIEASDRSSEEKNALITRLERAALQPKYMILKNINSYGFSTDERNTFIQEFFRLSDKLDVVNFGEGRTSIALKAQYGY